MWSYKIVSKTSSNTPEPTSRKIRGEDIRARILERQLKRCGFKKDDHVLLTANGHPARIKEILYDEKQVIWKNKLPYFLVIHDDKEDKEYVAHPSLLKKVKR